MDSGASSHKCHQTHLFCNIVKSHRRHSVNLPNGSTKLITHTREIELNTDMKLGNVLYIPEFKYNLMSVSQLLRENGIQVIFNANCCTLRDQFSK